MKKTILLDLDGVLNNYTGDYSPVELPYVRIGAKDFLQTLSEEFIVKIFTTRNRLMVSKWLIENNLDKFVSDVTNVKEPAWIHVDDRCLKFTKNYNIFSCFT
ncbi:hypothetical protein J6G99_07905 [bacterium]|nr:hypothetical protein [bacterium]